MISAISVRPIETNDYKQWRPLWDGYNAFYGRHGETALPESITQATWDRFFDPGEPVHAVVATEGQTVVALVHYLFHRSTTRLQDVCYLQDLFTAPSHRGRRIGQELIRAVYAAAQAEGSSRVYWTTQTTNTAGVGLFTTRSLDMPASSCTRMSCSSTSPPRLRPSPRLKLKANV